METDEAPNDAAPPSSNETDVNMQDAKGAAEASGAENGVPESGDKPVRMETETKVGVHCLGICQVIKVVYPFIFNMKSCLLYFAKSFCLLVWGMGLWNCNA